ncbi:Hsp20/alpha crystallin family protein [Patescibacteria group bacterium]
MFGKKKKDEEETSKEITTEEVTEEVTTKDTTPKKIVPKEEPAEKKENKEDWLDEEEYEGQLTLDVYQDDDNVVVKSTIAGVRPEDLEIAINNEMLTIKGSRRKEAEVKEDDYFHQECYWGSFSRSVILPLEVEADQIDASLKDGILTVKLPKSRKAKARKIEVRAGE